MKPYYSESGITIYYGDCREVLPQVSVGCVLTDPPYGIARVWKGGFGNGWQKSRLQKDERNSWDEKAPADDFWPELLGISQNIIVWGGNYFPLPPSRGWLAWIKPERNFSMSEAELAWTSIDTVVRVYEAARHIEDRQHPTEKPLGLMRWCLLKIPDGTVLDPFMGSGTTLRAAKDLGRKAIGIEIEEKYCEIAANRLRQEVFAFPRGATQDREPGQWAKQGLKRGDPTKGGDK